MDRINLILTPQEVESMTYILHVKIEEIDDDIKFLEMLNRNKDANTHKERRKHYSSLLDYLDMMLDLTTEEDKNEIN